MSPGYGYHQLQTMKMRMTPQLRQAIRILQLSTPELLDVVRQELQENPILETDGADGWRSFSFDPSYDPLNQAVSHDHSLERHLMEQLLFVSGIPQMVRKIVTYMIGNLDANGYLRVSLSEIAESLPADPFHVERALGILQSLEPIGIGARNLKECLLLQAQHLQDCPAVVIRLIENHLEDLASCHIHKIKKNLQASQQDIQSAIGLIKGLNPRPGALFHKGEIKYIVPDVIVERSGDRVVVTLHDSAAPRLSVNERYRRMLKESREGPLDRKLLEEKWRSAAFFLKCLEQRRLTLLWVSQAIMEEQDDFLRQGPSALKPLILKQIADQVQLHESTVSRAAAGKYAQTPWGVFELAFFFPSGVNRDIGDAASSESVKARIAELVAGEDRMKPLSDQKLAELLQDEGIRISRRTVTKYREELGISSSVKRKHL